jgi:hypothetical protein
MATMTIYSEDRLTRVVLTTWYWRFAWSTAGANILVESWHSTWFWGAWDKILVPELSLNVYTHGKVHVDIASEPEALGPIWTGNRAGGGFRQIDIVNALSSRVQTSVNVFAAAGQPARPDGTITLTRLVADGRARLKTGEYVPVGPSTARY